MKIKQFFFLLLLGICLFPTISTQAQGGKWTSANGPWGGDATAFHIDGKGTYWLGTGSSGGVYRSFNKGESWEAVNGGIGTAHVSWIGVINGQLHIEVADEDSLVRGGQHPFRMYAFQGGKSWGPVADEKNDFMVKMAYETTMLRYESILSQFPHSFYDGAFVGTDKEGFINQAQSPDQKERPWITEKQVASIAGLAIPNDVYPVRGWNFYTNEEKELVVLGKTNVYILRNNAFVIMGKKDLVATDIYQLAHTADGNTYAVSNYRDLYHYQNKTWKLLFDSYQEKRAATDNGVSSRLNRHPDGKIVTVLAGDIYSIKDGKLALLVAQKQLVGKANYALFQEAMPERLDFLFESDTVNVRFSNAAYNREGSLWAYGEANYWGVLMKLDAQGNVQEVVYDERSAYGGGAFVASNPYTGDVWFFSDQHAQWLDQPAVTLPFHLDYSTGGYGNLVAFSKEGKMAFPILHDTWKADFKRLVVVETKGKEISSTEYHAPLESVTCLGFDRGGNLYAGTGYQVINPRDICAWNMRGKANGLYIFGNDGWKKMNNEVNPWILSLQIGNEGLWVGTSGSGLWEYLNITPVQWPRIAYIKSGEKKGLSEAGETVFPTKYHDIIPYEDYYKIHGYEGSHPYTPEISPESIFALQEEKDGLWRLGNLRGVTTEEAFHGFFHTSTGGLLGYRVSNKEKGTRAYWRIATDGLKVSPLPYAKIYTFEKGYITQWHDGTYRICNDEMNPISRVPFKGFKQVNNRIYLKDLGQTEVWNIDDWSRMGSLPFLDTGISLGDYLQTMGEGGASGILNTNTAQIVFHPRFDSLDVLGDLWVAFKGGKVGLYHTTTEGYVPPSKEKWVLPLEYEMLDMDEKINEADLTAFGAEEEDGMAAIILRKDGKVGVFSAKNRDWLLPMQYEDAQYISNYQFLVKTAGQEGVYDAKSNSWVLALEAQDIEFLPNEQICIVSKNGMKGLYSASGGWLIECVYDNLELLKPHGAFYYFKITKNNLYGLISPEGKVSIKPAYMSIELGIEGEREAFKMYREKKKKDPEIHWPVMERFEDGF